MNKVILVGNLTRDPELTQTTGGISVCRFSLAVQRRFTNSEGTREADFFNIIVWRVQGENCAKYLKKGSKAGIIGTIQNRTYDANDGTKRYVTEIIADEVEFLSQKNSESAEPYYDENQDTAPRHAPKKQIADLEPVKDDDLPF